MRFLFGGVSIFCGGCSEVFMYFSCLYFTFTSFILVLWLLSDSTPCTYVDIYIYILRLLLLSFTYLYMCCFFFSLYAHASYILYAIYYFCFTLRCRDEFCLRCFRNTGCQNFLAMNSLLTKFFKRLC